MSDRPVVVVGDGAAGLAAALRLSKSGHSVQVISAGAGASVLACGAVDFDPWEHTTANEPVDIDALSLLGGLGLHRVPEGGVLLATSSGILRRARGADRALLDLNGLPRGTVLVPRIEHHGWDAVTLARSWADTDLARARGLAFNAAPAILTRFRDERARHDVEMAERHDDPVRLAWLADRVRDALAKGGPYVAVILPPWLGIEAPRAEWLSARLEIPCGEVASALASTPGRRFEKVRDRALANVTHTWTRVTRITSTPAFWTLTLEDAPPVEASAIILAAGGLVGGGLALDAHLALHTSIEIPAAVGARGRVLSPPGSPFGPPPESIAWPFARDPILDQGGLLVDADHRVQDAPPGLFACGDLVADRPRTWLKAWISGAQAAMALHRSAGSVTSPA